MSLLFALQCGLAFFRSSMLAAFFVPLFHSTAFSLLMCLCVCVSQIDHGIGIVSYGNGAQTIK